MLQFLLRRDVNPAVMLCAGPVHLKIITGQGHHSVDNTPKIWPAMKQFLEQRSLDYRTFPGYFVVPLNTLEAP